MFSFLLCAEILKLEGVINEVEWNFLLRGGLMTEQVTSIRLHENPRVMICLFLEAPTETRS